MDKRTKYTRRSAIVRQFVAGLADNTEQQICRLYQVGFDNGAVCGKLNLGRERLASIKLKMARGIKKAGIQPGDETMEKQCKICKRIFPLQEFHLDKGLLDGHRNICKECAIRKAKDSRCRKKEKTDGLSDVLHSMKARCYNPKHQSYKRYGERGIDICQEWLANENQFYDWCRRHGYARGLQLDRIDNDRGYSPENCRFVTPSENQRNSSKCPYGEKEVAVIRRAYRLGAITQTALAKFYGVDQSTISKICSKKVWRELEQCPST